MNSLQDGRGGEECVRGVGWGEKTVEIEKLNCRDREGDILQFKMTGGPWMKNGGKKMKRVSEKGWIASQSFKHPCIT